MKGRGARVTFGHRDYHAGNIISREILKWTSFRHHPKATKFSVNKIDFLHQMAYFGFHKKGTQI